METCTDLETCTFCCPMSLSDAGRHRLRYVQHSLPGKKAVVYRGSKDDLIREIEAPVRAEKPRGPSVRELQAGNGVAPRKNSKTDTGAPRGGVSKLTSSSSAVSASGKKASAEAGPLTSQPPESSSSSTSAPAALDYRGVGQDPKVQALIKSPRITTINKTVFKGKQVRYVVFLKKVYWLAADVCDTLGVPGMMKIVKHFDRECKQLITIADSGSSVLDSQWTFSAQGVFRLVLRYPTNSVEFQEWVDESERTILRGGTTRRSDGSEKEQGRLSGYAQLGALCMDDFMHEMQDLHHWVPITVQSGVDSYKQTVVGATNHHTCLKAKCVFRVPPSVVFDMIWDAEARPSWDRFAVLHEPHRKIRGCHTAEQVNAASVVHYLREKDVPELGIDQPRDACVLLYKVFDLDGSYRIAMRSVAHPGVMPDGRHRVGTAGQPPALVRMEIKCAGYCIEPDHHTRGAHSNVTFVCIVDYKAPASTEYLWEHLLDNFASLREACQAAST